MIVWDSSSQNNWLQNPLVVALHLILTKSLILNTTMILKSYYQSKMVHNYSEEIVLLLVKIKSLEWLYWTCFILHQTFC